MLRSWSSKTAQIWILVITTFISFSSFLIVRDLVTSSSWARIQALSIEAPLGIGSSRKTSTHKFAAFELEGVSIALPFPDYPPSLDSDQALEWLLGTLEKRLRVYSDHTDQPACGLNYNRYASVINPSHKASRNAHPISFAINLKNSRHVLPSQMKAIVTAIHHLLPHHAIYLSIYENDSQDATALMLGQLASALDRLGIDGLSITSSRMHSGINVENRIDLLAEIRNSALRPLLPFAGAGTIIFLNDVILCAADIFELLLQATVQSADVVLGLDWAYSGPEPDAKTYVYDAWVLRGINGRMVYEQGTENPWPVAPPDGQDWMNNAFSTQSAEIQERWLNTLPFEVYAGWGGIVALKADLFVEHGLRFRSSKATGWTGGSASGSMRKWGQLVTDDDYMAGDCPGDSECGLIMRDIWNIRGGKARVVLASQVNTAYSIDEWKAFRLVLPFVPRDDRVTLEEFIDWSNVSMPRNVVCMPTRTEDGMPHDAHDTKLFRYLTLDPMYEPTSSATYNL